MRILYETADQVDTYRAVWYYTESRPLCQKLHPKQMRRTNQVMTTQPPSSDELNTKALTVLRAARNVFLTHGFSATTDMIQREAGVSKSTVYVGICPVVGDNPGKPGLIPHTTVT